MARNPRSAEKSQSERAADLDHRVRVHYFPQQFSSSHLVMLDLVFRSLPDEDKSSSPFLKDQNKALQKQLNGK